MERKAAARRTDVTSTSVGSLTGEEARLELCPRILRERLGELVPARGGDELAAGEYLKIRV
jgi:hypothetical protein